MKNIAQFSVSKSKLIKYLTITGILMGSIWQALAKNLPVITSLAYSNPANGFTIPTISDPAFGSYTIPSPTWYSNFANVKVKNIIRIKIDRTNNKYIAHNGVINIDILVDYYTYTPGVTGTNHPAPVPYSLTLNYDTALLAKEKDELVVVIDNAIQSTVQVTNVNYTTSPGNTYAVGHPDIIVQNTIEIERISVLTIPTFLSFSFTGIKPNAAGRPQFLTMSWVPWTGAEEYELEYLFINDPVQMAGFTPLTGPPVWTGYPYSFRHNCTRVVVTTGTEFTIPNLFPDGHVVFRVRAVTRDLQYQTEPVYGDWSMAESGTVNLTLAGPGSGFSNIFHTVNPHAELNWSSNTVFAEESKTGVSITYFDGTLRAREGVAYNNSTETYTVSQTILDYLGREALVAMPSIALDNHGFAFRSGFNRNNDAGSKKPYSYLDFDLNQTGSDDIVVKPMSDTTGVNKYYSPNLLLSSQYLALDAGAKRMHTFIPKSDGYAFSQVEFTRDPSGRTWRQGGVGKTHQLKAFDHSGSWIDGKQTLLWDGTPMQEELFVLFGNEVGDYQKYKKVMTQDPNGQVSVAYIDPYGRTIATALAGAASNTNNNLDPLNSAGHNLNFISVMKETTQDKFEGIRVINQEILVPNDGYWKFYYSYPKTKYSLCDNYLCIECAYDITLSVTNPNDYDKQMLPGGQPITINVGQPEGDTAYCSELQLFQYNPSPVEVYLTKGSYVVSKTLKINHDYRNSLKEQWLAGSSCVKPFTDFVKEEQDKLGNKCNLTCEDCEKAKAGLEFDLDSIKLWCQTNSINYLEYNPYLATLTQYNEMVEFCQDACEVNTPCQNLYDAILMDMQPGGQYAKYVDGNEDGITKDLSQITESTVFKTGGDLPWHCIIDPNTPTWRVPKSSVLTSDPNLINEYLNEDGTLALIRVISENGVEKPAYNSFEIVNGKKYVKPRNLTNVEDFIEYYQRNLHWAKSLAYYHPEYCFYTNCLLVEPLYKFDRAIMAVQSAKDAIERGLYNPLNMNGSNGELGDINSVNINYTGLEITNDIVREVALNQGTVSQPNHKDPVSKTTIYNPVGSQNPWVLPSGLNISSLISKLQNVAIKNPSCSTTAVKTIWEIMEEQRAAYGLTSFDTCVEDLFWPILRGLYLQKKNEWLNEWYESQCVGYCVDAQDYTKNTFYRIKTPRWRQTGINDLMADFPESPWFTKSVWANIADLCDPAAVKDKIDDQIGNHCSNQCDANAEVWMQRLEYCYSTNAYLNGLSASAKVTVLADIKAAFKNLCMGGCDLQNPYGSRTVNPARLSEMSGGQPVFPYKDVEAVLKHYLDPNGNNPWFVAGICDDLLVDFPGDYGHDYLAYNGPGMDTCACRADKNIRPGITEKCPPLGHDSLKINDCACSKTKALRDPIQALHGAELNERCQNCITCKELDEPVADFLDRYDVASMTDTILVQQLLENWLNKKFGFNLNYMDYWFYAAGCVDSNEFKLWPWYKVWQHIGMRRMVASVETDFRYTEPLILSIPQKQKEYWKPLYSQPEKEYWVSKEVYSSGGYINLSPLAPFATNGAIDVECNCRKILSAAKLAEDPLRVGQFPGGGMQAYNSMYSPAFPSGGPTFDQLKTKCCELFNAGQTPPINCPGGYEIGQPFSQNARNEIQNQINQGNITEINYMSADMPCTPEPEEECMRDLDTCGCNKLQSEYALWMAHPVYKPTGTSPVSFEVFLLKNTGVTITNATELRDKCVTIFMKGVAKDKNGNAVRGYVPGVSSSWWSKSAQSNLKQEVEDNKISGKMRIPKSWSCDPDCNDETPCTKFVKPCDLKDIFRWFVLQNWFTESGGQKRHEKMGTATFGDIDEYLALMLEWTDLYAAHLKNNTTPTDPIEAERVAFLKELFGKLDAFYKEHGCPKNFELEYYLKLMLGCGSGNIQTGSTCLTAPDCAQIGSRLKNLMSTETWPNYTDPNYANNADYAIDFQNWYYLYLYKKATNTQTQAEDDWAAAVLDDLNTAFNSCYPNTVFGMDVLLRRLKECIPVPKGSSPPCETCYAADFEWLGALQDYLRQATQKPDPDVLTDFQYYLKPNPGSQISAYYFTTFYNSVLYHNGTDQENLTWNLDESYQGGKLMPGMRTLIKDNNGFRLDFSLDWPTDESRWNFNYILNFIDIEPIKTKGCNQPKYFKIKAVFDIPEDHKNKYPSGFCNNAKTDPNLMLNDECYDTVTLIGKIWESTNGRGVSKVVPCLGCNKLCNRPFAVAVVEKADPCEDEKNIAVYNAIQRYNMHIKTMGDYFDSVYREKCYGASDKLEVEYNLMQYHYTLYYYDQAGQLIKTVPPAGVDIDNTNLSQADRQALANDRITTARAHVGNNSLPRANMYHNLVTNYRYNSGGQLVWQHTPDGGEGRFWYDALGRVALSQNSKQEDAGKYSFSTYDALGRPKMAGELEPGSQTVAITDYHLSFEDAVRSGNTITDDGISIQSGLNENAIATYSNTKHRILVPETGILQNPNVYAQLNNFDLAASTSYTLSFESFLMGSLNFIQYTIWDNTGTLASGTVSSGGIQTVPFSTTASSNGFVSVKFYETITMTTDRFEIDDIVITHQQTGIQVPNPRFAATNGWLNTYVASGPKTEVIQTWFDAIPANASSEFTGVLSNGQGKNMRNRVAMTTKEAVYDGNYATYDHATAYSYDIHGNAERIVQNIPSLKHLEVNLYTLDYEYDLISGKVNRVKYQAGKADQWMHKYEYDGDNRLVRAYTSRDGYIWERDAKYFYYLHGPLGRTELGQLQVQGIDHSYTLHGWMKGVNSGSMTPENDMGQDGFIPATGSNINQYVARDAFAYYLSYYDNDYNSLGGSAFEPTRAGSDLQTRYRNLYNGNIAQMGTLLPKLSGAGSWAGTNTPISRNITPVMLGNVYHYDQLNRITKHLAFEGYTAPTGTGTGSWQGGGVSNGEGNYYETFAYDANGNITTLTRNAATVPAGGGGGTGQVGSGPTMDNMTYNYDVRSKTIVFQQNTSISVAINQPYSNKLYLVDDQVTGTDYSSDIDDQGTFNSTPGTINTANNYGYDKLGNLVKDVAEQIADIQWNVSGKITKITRSSGSKKADLAYGYDASGTRLFKVVIPKQQNGTSAGTRMSQEHWDTTWYIKDAAGNAMATYKTTHKRLYPALPETSTMLKRFSIDELYIYGSKRHGVLKADEMLAEIEYDLELGDYVMPDSTFPVQSETIFTVIQSTQFGITNYTAGTFSFTRGYKQYELSNHLGNVLVTILDRKWGLQTSTPSNPSNSDYYLSYVVTVTDYYAFGSAVVERSKSFGSIYRYGFNNQEREGELGEYYSFEYRVHDARLGRFLSIDPLCSKFAFASPYVFAKNKPIQYIDWLGCEEADPMKKGAQGVVQQGWGLWSFCYNYGIRGSNFVEQADALIQSNLASFPGYPSKGTTEEKSAYINSDKYSLHPNQALYLPTGTKVNRYFQAMPGDKAGTYKEEIWFENGLNAQLGDAPIVYNQKLFIPNTPKSNEALQNKSPGSIAEIGFEKPPTVDNKRVEDHSSWLDEGYLQNSLAPDAGGITFTAGKGPVSGSYSICETETGNQSYVSGTYTIGGGFVKSPVTFTIDMYYRTEFADPAIPTEDYLKGTTYIRAFGIFTYSWVENERGETVLTGYQYGLNAIGFGVTQSDKIK